MSTIANRPVVPAPNGIAPAASTRWPQPRSGGGPTVIEALFVLSSVGVAVLSALAAWLPIRSRGTPEPTHGDDSADRADVSATGRSDVAAERVERAGAAPQDDDADEARVAEHR